MEEFRNNQSVCNETDGCLDTAFNWANIDFNYGLKDKTLGYSISSEHTTPLTEKYIAAPLSRNYSLMVFPEASFPIYIDFTNIEENCTVGGQDISVTGLMRHAK